jgi:peptidoglycan/xylan/chitin deacetylase (PgdA/CDA1 family)
MIRQKRSRVLKSSVERYESIRLLLFRQLPPAMYGQNVAPNDSIIAFAQHAPRREYLESKLRYLAQNGYDTVTTGEYVEWLTGVWQPTRPTVLLTFDDGRRGFAQVTYPLVKAYGFRSVIFVCPGLVDLASRGDDSLSQFARKTILTWDELRDLHREGDVDIQSHGMWHNAVPCSSSPTTIGVNHVQSIMAFPDMLPPDGRLERALTGQGQDVCRYKSVPLYAWPSSAEGTITQDTLRSDLAHAKAKIEEHLPGHRVRGFAFPWWKGTRTAAELARGLGHELVFWGLSGIDGHLGRENVDPLRIGRLGFDWICCLPGKGRKSIVRLLYEKVKGFHDDRY